MAAAATLNSSFGQIVLVPLKVAKSIFWQLLAGLIFSVLLVACGSSSTSNSSTSSPSTGAGNGSTPGNTLTSGTWKGQATSSNGDTFDMTLSIDTVTGDTFTGKLVTGVVDTPTYREDTIMKGKITGNRITFSTPTQVMSILSNYQATISNGQMTGSWTTQDQPPLTGTFTLRKTA